MIPCRLVGWTTGAWALGLQAATVGDEVVIDVSGAGAGPCPPALGGGCLGVQRVDRALSLVADAQGSAQAVVLAPRVDTLWLQAVEPARAALSDVVELSLVPLVQSLSCVPHADNVLRFDCSVGLDRPAPVELEVVDDQGVSVVVVRDEAVASTHDVEVYGLWADDAFTLRVRADGGPPFVDGLVTTSLPVGADLDFALAGATDAGPFLFNMGCDGTDVLVVADSVGRVRWYQDVADLAVGAVASRGFALTPQGTMLVLVDRYVVAELGFDGALRWSTPMTDPVHHEVLWWQGRVAALDARALPFPNGATYVMDGVQWLDGADGAPLAHFAHEDVADPQVVLTGSSYWGSVFPGALDWAHGNALAMADDGTGVLSFKSLDTLQRVVLDPDAPDFGALRWTLTGKAASPLATDLARVSSTGVTPLTFGDQHHVTVLGPDELLLFDNQPGPSQLSRVLRLRIDEGLGTADLVEAWPLNRRCPGQGSAELRANGNVLADCAMEDTLLEIEAGTGVELWSMTPSCANGATPPRPLYRALEVGW